MSVSALPRPITSNHKAKLDPIHLRWRSLPKSSWSAMYHSNADEVCREVDNFFLENWNWRNEEEKTKFVKSKLTRVTCYFLPLAQNDRIALVCRLVTVHFLLDGMNFLIQFLNLSNQYGKT